MSEPEEILAATSAAFPVEPLPPAAALFNDHCEECIDVSSAFGARRWTEVGLTDLKGKETALLTAEAWRYYLPAMICWSVRDPEALDTLPEFLVYQLEPPEPGKSDEWFEERKNGFTEAQRHVIIGYLKWYRNREVAEYSAIEMEPPAHVLRALAYWGRSSEESA